MKNKKIEDLIIKFISKSINANELEELSLWLEKGDNATTFKEYIRINYALDYNLMSFDADKAFLGFLEKTEASSWQVKVNKGFFRSPYAIAASIAVIMVSSLLFYLNQNGSVLTKDAVTEVSTVKPGTDKAVLTLENGEYVTLEKGKQYASANRTSDGEKLRYDGTEYSGSRVEYNFLTIPRGGQFFVELSDGSQVWLNADSKLKYPINFIKGQTREVELLYGEAYFDVSPSSNHNGDSFMVKNRGQVIEVLGTEFNIKAYLDEGYAHTTLAEGSIKVGNGRYDSVLSPGQQAVIGHGTGPIRVLEVDVYTETSWKDGVFSFEDKSLKEIMKVLSRWYDVEIVFENRELEDVRFKGVLGRNQNIQEILSIMKSTRLNNYEIKEKTILLK